jgi:hypothetical protein
VEVRGIKLAIVGINTAWLCQDDQDWGQLTAGRTMVDAALREAEKAAPQLVIVLGHHPLDAMTGDRPWSDGKRIRQRLEQANAVYLHGHLHASGNQKTGDSLQSVLAIQAPSAFQVGDSQIWRNGLMWGKADLDSGWLAVEPLKWNNDDSEYKFDTDAGRNRELAPGRDAFRFRLPGKAQPPPSAWPPLGWRTVDRETLAELTADRPDVGAMAGYFDGALPDWRVVLAEGVRLRWIVETTITRFRQRHHGAPRPLATLLTGAGGEGKSTALLQAAAALVRDTTQSWTCLHREAAAAEVPANLLEGLEFRAGHAWIVALDDAENAGKGLVAALRRIAPRTDVHLLLAAREADWAIRGLTREMWQEVAEFRLEPMPGLDEKDARRIVEGWQAYGEDAMGRLRGVSVEGAAKALLGHANEHAARPGEGALLGALLITRQGKELKDRVRAFVSPLVGRGGVKGFDLRDIYAMVAAMHAENQLYLSRSVLAFALGCDEQELENILRILRREAMLDSGETYILSRHRRIAEAACETLADDGYNVRRWFPYLARSARREFVLKHSCNPDISKWQFALAKHFVGKGENSWIVARSVAKALHEAEADDAILLISYSKVLRETKLPGDAMALLKAKGEPFRSRRDVLFEWGVVAGNIGDPGLSAWLAGRSLADDGVSPDANQCKHSLAGLGRAFELLHESTGRSIFANARAACGRLGQGLPNLDATARGHFERFWSANAEGVGPRRSHGEDTQTLQRAVALAADEMEPDNDDPPIFEDLLGDPIGYRYTGLLRVIHADVPAKRTIHR